MPKSVPYDQRKAFIKPEVAVEPANHTVLSQFDMVNNLVQINVILYKGMHERLMKLAVPDMNVFLSQAVLDIINLSRGLSRTEPTKSEDSWYLRIAKVPGIATFKFHGVNQTVKPSYSTLRPIERKRIDIPRYANILNSEPINKDKSLVAANLPVTIFNESVRLAKYWQMYHNDLLMQCLDIAIFEKECELIAQDGAANRDKLRSFSDREERLENRKYDAIAERLNKATEVN
jgi:hypothetical protein